MSKQRKRPATEDALWKVVKQQLPISRKGELVIGERELTDIMRLVFDTGRDIGFEAGKKWYDWNERMAPPVQPAEVVLRELMPKPEAVAS